MTYTFGIEIETSGVSYPNVQRALRDAGIKGFEAKPDGTPSVDAEIVLPPMADCQIAWEYVADVCRVLDRIGCRINRSCGLHVHVGNAPLSDETTAAQYTGSSIAYKERTGRFHTNHGAPFDAAAVRDIMIRYSDQQDVINSMLPRSRTHNRYCQPLNQRQLESASTISDLNHGKFYAINLQTWGNGTIEFRQHSGTIEADKIKSWVKFILNLINWTMTERVTDGTRTIVQTTPVDPFRRASRVGVQYAMMRTTDGATTREIMDATGCSEQRVRAAVSEIRNRVGQAAVVTHTQQSNGAAYGDGTDHTRYQVLEQVETQQSGVQLLPENRRGMASVWAGLDDDLFEIWQQRIIDLSR